MVIEPHIGIGIGGSSGTATYASTGGQLPFDDNRSRSTAQFCGGATLWPGFAAGPVNVGLDVNVCTGSSATLFTINRHGPGGDVDLHARTDVLIDLLAKVHVPTPHVSIFTGHISPIPVISGGLGLSLRKQTLTLTSDQSFFGGGVPSASESSWQTGFVLSAGVSTFVCPDCIGGNPLRVGVEGRVRFFPSQSVSLTSPIFGFTETGSTGRTTDYSAMITVGVPLGGH